MTFPSGERPLSRLEVFWEMWSGWSESTTWPGADDMKPLFKHVAASSSSESTVHLARPCTSCEGEAHQVSKRGVEVGPGLGHIKSSAATTIHCLTYWTLRVKIRVAEHPPDLELLYWSDAGYCDTCDILSSFPTTTCLLHSIR